MKKILLLITIMVFGLTSCLQDEASGPKPKGPNDVTFNVQVLSNTTNTRGVTAEEGENVVNDLTLMFFSPSKDGTGKFQGFYKVPATDLPKDGRLAFDLNIEFTGTLSKNEGYNILAMANMLNGNYFEDDAALTAFLDGLKSTDSETDVTRSMAWLLAGVDYDENDNSQAIPKDYLPMTVRCSKEESSSQVAMELVRTVVRFDLVNEAADYTLVGASIWNAFSRPSIWDNVIPDYTKERTKRFYGVSATANNSIVGGLYGVENVSADPKQNDDKTTCLIVALLNNNSGKTFYYRLNVQKNSDTGQHLTRNNVYRATINGVLGEGASNEKDAYNGGKFLLDVTVNPWDRDENGLVMTDGENMLVLPTRKAVFGPSADSKEYYIYTRGNGTLELVNLELPEGITTKLTGSTLTITVTEFLNQNQRKGSIELRYAGLVGVIEIIQRSETAKSLELSYTKVGVYPAGGAENMIANSKPITVTSSGPWTATILGGDNFSFSMTYFVSELKGSNGSTISAIYSRRANADPDAKTNVVLVTLDDDPENYRSVIVLTQKGTGVFTPNPVLPTAIDFNADKTTKPDIANTFTLTSPDAEDSWNFKITGADAKMFRLVSYDANDVPTILTEGKELGAGPTNKVKFGVVPATENYDRVYSANLEIYHNGGLTTVPLKQDAYSMTLTATPTSISATGGTSTLSITLSGGNTAGLRMDGNLSVTSNAVAGYRPTFVGGATSFTGLSVTALPAVEFPAMAPPFASLFTGDPVVTVSLKINGKELTASTTISQQRLTFSSSLNSQTLFDSYGGWQNNGQFMMQWWTFMRDASLFGPSGKVWSPSAIGNHHNSYTQMPLPNTRIWNINQYGYSSGNASLSSNWRGVKNAVVILSTYNQNDMFQYVFGAGNNGGYTINTSNYNPNNPNLTLTSAPGASTKTPLWKYLIGGDGPFGAVDVSGITFGGNDNANCSLSAWPSTFIPMIMYQGRCVMGVDPTNRIIWTGETGVFHTYGNAYSSSDSEGSKFLKNLIAYTVNVALYGDTFNDQFKQ